VSKYLKVGLILLIAILLILGLLYWLFLYQMEDVGKSKSTDFKIELKEKIYISARYWGLTGDHQEIVLSNKPIKPGHKSYSKEENYIFYTSDIFYKIENDSIITIYAPESSISEPINKFTNTTVKINRLRNADEIKDYTLNYQKYGLQKISVYQ
jgi:hypothetical protein